jgi:siderophore synthetase component
MAPDDATWLGAGLDRARWERANRELIAKILTEFVFEEIIAPDQTDLPDLPDGTSGRVALTLHLPGDLDLDGIGRRRALGHLRVDPASLRWSVGGADAPLPDVAELVAIAAPALRIDPSTAANAIVELASTLAADVAQLAHGRPIDELLDVDPLLLEGEMRAHPWIVANKGRLGFGADDLARYSPEAQAPFGVVWLAVAPSAAVVATADGHSHHDLVRAQVGDDFWAELRARAAAGGLDPDTAAYVPVHPWQWDHRVAILHAGDLARGTIVHLGTGRARYLPQQSIRTIVDVDHPECCSLKLALSILNTSVYRGIPPERAAAAPALTDWLRALVAGDAFLAETGLVLLGEIGAASVAHRPLAALPDVPYQHTEMLGAIWREPVASHLAPGERAITMAALLHRDPAGVSFVDRLIERSGVGTAAWVEQLHRITLPPLFHVLYKYGIAFSPHAQNCLVVLRDDVPVRLVVKDFVDDCMISGEALPELASIPSSVREALGDGIEGLILVQWIQGGLLVCVHRYLSEILDDTRGFGEDEFWASAVAVVREYQDRFADELGGRYEVFDLDAPAFVKLCLNRVRLFERGYEDAADRPVASAVGWIDNPLALPEDPDNERAYATEASWTT